MSDGDSGWESLGGNVAQPVVGSNADGRLEVFGIGADGALWHIWQWRPGGDWSEWASFGGSFDPAGDTGLIRPAVGTNADGRLEVFLRGPDGRLWHTWQLAPNDGWSPLEAFPSRAACRARRRW
jgi:hypothetical protein